MPDAPVDRLELWVDSENMNVPSCPWMVGGDFNFILNEDEKLAWSSLNVLMVVD